MMVIDFTPELLPLLWGLLGVLLIATGAIIASIDPRSPRCISATDGSCWSPRPLQPSRWVHWQRRTADRQRSGLVSR